MVFGDRDTPGSASHAPCSKTDVLGAVSSLCYDSSLTLRQYTCSRSIVFHSVRGILLLIFLRSVVYGQSYIISTFAGGGLPVNVPALMAGLNFQSSVAVDAAGNIFFANEQEILRLDAASHLVTLIAGTGVAGFSGDDGPATSAQLSAPQNVAVDGAGNVYIADSSNNRIRRVSGGVITTIAGTGVGGTSGDNGPAASAELVSPQFLAVDSAGVLYFSEGYNVREIRNGVVAVVAGNGQAGFSGDNGPATSAQLSPGALAVDSAGNLYIAGNGRVREVSGGIIKTVAGNGTIGFSGDNGPATAAELNASGLSVDSAGALYISDDVNNRIRKVFGGIISTVAGNGVSGFSGDNGAATNAELYNPRGVAADSLGNVYIADNDNFRIRKVSGGIISTVAGTGTEGYGGDNGPPTSAQLNGPAGVAVDAQGNLYITDSGNARVREVSNGVISTIAGNGVHGFTRESGPAASAELSWPEGIAVDSSANVYISDASNSVVREVSNGTISTVAGDGTEGWAGDGGPALSAELITPIGLAVGSSGAFYIADRSTPRIREVSDGVINTVAGNGTPGFAGDNGLATAAQLGGADGVALDSAGALYIADTGNNTIRKVANGIITTVAGTAPQNYIPDAGFSGDGGPATSAQMYGPQAIAVDNSGNLYIADTGNNRIRKVSGGIITTIAGNGLQGFSGDGGDGTNAELFNPSGVAVDSAGNVYIADTANNRIRILTPTADPAITPSGVVPVYSSVPVVQPGSWISIYGANLANGNYTWTGNFPQSLGGTSVTIDNRSAFLWFVSPTQINLQVPDDPNPGTVNVVVNSPAGTVTSTVTLAAYGPSFSLLDAKHVAGEVATPNGTGAYGNGSYDLVGPTGAFSFKTRPVIPGETLQLFGVGFGPTTPTVLAGRLFSGSAPTNDTVTVTIDGVAAMVTYSGLIEAGLYQINVVVPQLPPGDMQIQAIVNGIQTPVGPLVTVQ